ncbi:hypothetical protein QQM79_20915 [Marinobacteraceae bacterium S3BR75-40.1]
MEPASKKPSYMAKLGNRFLILLQVLFYLPSLAFALYGREMWSEFSTSIYGSDRPLMGSPLLDMMVGWPIGVLATAILVASLVKEFKIHEFRQRVYGNGLACLALVFISGGMIWLVGTPIQDFK